MWASHKATPFHLFSSTYSFMTFPLPFFTTVLSWTELGCHTFSMPTIYALQRGLNNLNQYCLENFIEVNVSKSKVQVFHRGHLPTCAFELNGRPIERVNDFVYLGFNFSTQLSFTKHAQNITSKARSKCGLLFARLPISNLPLNLVIDLFSIFILPIFLYGLPLWFENCSTASLQSIDATLTKYLKRYLLVPAHSNNATIHFLTSTLPLSKNLRRAAPNAIRSLTFPSILHGHRLSFFPNSSQELNDTDDRLEILERSPSTFWLSRIPFSIPLYPQARKRLFR